MLKNLVVEWLKQQKYIVSQSGVWKPKIKVSAGLVPFEASFFGLQISIFFLYLHKFFPLCVSRS